MHTNAERGPKMQNLSKEYVLLFNAITNVEQSLMDLRDQLIAVQREAEDLYLSSMDISAEQACQEAPDPFPL